MTYWTSFATNFSPNNERGPNWPTYDLSDTSMTFGDFSFVETNRDKGTQKEKKNFFFYKKKNLTPRFISSLLRFLGSTFQKQQQQHI